MPTMAPGYLSRCATRLRRGRKVNWPGNRSVMRSSSTMPTARGWSWPPSTPPSPTGSCSGASSVSEKQPSRTASSTQGAGPGMSTFTVLNPATEEPVAEVPQFSAEQADEAIERAAAAEPGWNAVSPGDRARLLRRFAEVVDAHIDELADLEVAGSGHPVGQARWEAGNVADVLRYYSAAPERLFGRQIPVPGGLNVTFQEPIGVVGLIVPWNFPMPILGWGLGPALAAGNPVIAKPAERTPLTAIRIGELALEAGLPEGVFQVVPGKGSVVGERLVDHPAVRKILFTGSTEVGRQIMAGCARQVKRVTLELGGKSANIVFADADLERAAATAPMRSSTTPGRTAARGPGSWCRQTCSTGSWNCSSLPCRPSPWATRAPLARRWGR